MNDLKKLAARLHEVTSHLAEYGWPEEIREIADALDAYADAQGSAEPVAWHVRSGPDRPWYYSPTAEKPYGGKLWTEYQPLYTIPPLPSVSREALTKALHDNHSPDVSFADITEAALRALGITITENDK